MSTGTENQVLVIGGGVTGMRTSLDLASLGIRAHLIERDRSLGGLLGQVNRVFPSMRLASDIIGPMISEIEKSETIKVHLSSEVRSLEEHDGLFRASLSVEGGPDIELEAGCIILATGLRPMDPTIIPEFGYGRYPEVMTSLEFEALLRSSERGIKGSGGAPVKKLVFIQCVGSRVERRGLPYCSAVCCMGAIKNALILKDMDPEMDISILYIDIRTHGKGWEDAYRQARKAGVKFIRGQPSMVTKRPRAERLVVCGENTLIKELYEIDADLVVLQVGLEQTLDSRELISMLKVGIRGDGLPDDEQVDGVFIAGSSESPKDIASCMAQAGACAAGAAGYMLRKSSNK
ncbi:MAG: CoB--CoM heterodisulfide reductase iron-sulfur subunit A family protein [Methanomassiliicoccales archaeon]|nr:CoB--CoM heterodisulfide reductase iron-sulfur subunit A family protein [Methanomassiliicoccales archaeon]NYT15990.1 CoB--CoM heterodisulfide reductase iron-sulfur subunit A family protein [Methanomassiliicoccales archaeon]